MSEATITRRDRTIGIALLILGVAVAIAPRFELAGQPINPWLVAYPWLLAALLLLTMNSAARPMSRLIRWGAAILFVGGFASPFIANFIDSSLGA